MGSLRLSTYLINNLEENGISTFWAENITLLLLFILIFIAGRIIFWISRKVVIGIFNRIAKKTKSSFDDLLLKNKVPGLISYIPFLFFIFAYIPGLFESKYEAFYIGSKNIIESISVILFL